MKTKSLIAAAVAGLVALPVAAPVLASETSSGLAQQSLLLGVAPGTLNGSELAALGTALKEGDATTAQFILGGASSVDTGVGTVSPGKAQLAALVGVNPADYSLTDLIRLNQAATDGDDRTFQTITANAGRNHVGSRGQSAGHDQLAAVLGVNGADYTLNELIQLEAASSEN